MRWNRPFLKGLLLWTSLLLISATISTQSAISRLAFFSYWKDPPGLPGEQSPKPYRTAGDCGGFPKIKGLRLPAGFCVGLVDPGEGLTFPRSIAFLGEDFLVTDMGGWAVGNGKLFLYRKKTANGYAKQVLLSRENVPIGERASIDRLHAVLADPKWGVIVGGAARVYGIDPLSENPKATVKPFLEGFPTAGRHPLRNMALRQADGTLFLNMGSSSDNCETGDGDAPNPRIPCPESDGVDPRGAIYRVKMEAPGVFDSKPAVYARGLRNSMALAIDPFSGDLIQAENSRDQIHRQDDRLDDQLEPREEINRVESGKHYGWPYCYNLGVDAPEYPASMRASGFSCAALAKPIQLLPAHAAPLGMLFHSGKGWPRWYKGKLLVSFHGYRDFGHRLVAFERGKNEREPVSGMPLEIVSGWEETPDHPMGSPVGIAEAPDGSVFIVEDKNRTILRVFYEGFPSTQGQDGRPLPWSGRLGTREDAEKSKRCAAMEKRLTRVTPPLFTQIQSKLIDRQCLSCHGSATATAGSLSLLACDDIGNAKRLLAKRAGGTPYVVPGKPEASELWLRLPPAQGYPPMPPSGFDTGQGEGAQIRTLLEEWIRAGALLPH